MHGDGSELERAGAVLLGLPDFEVLAPAEVGGEIELVVQTAARSLGCPRCGVVAAGKGRRPTLVRDLPARGRPVVLIWHKRLWTCPDSVCPPGSWTEQHPQIRARAALTERARRWAFEQVGRSKCTSCSRNNSPWASTGRSREAWAPSGRSTQHAPTSGPDEPN